jgi:hypothetical protein
MINLLFSGMELVLGLLTTYNPKSHHRGGRTVMDAASRAVDALADD